MVGGWCRGLGGCWVVRSDVVGGCIEFGSGGHTEVVYAKGRAFICNIPVTVQGRIQLVDCRRLSSCLCQREQGASHVRSAWRFFDSSAVRSE